MTLNVKSGKFKPEWLKLKRGNCNSMWDEKVVIWKRKLKKMHFKCKMTSIVKWFKLRWMRKWQFGPPPIGISGEAADIRGDRHLPRQLEAYRPGSHPAGVQGLGRPGGLERGLLPDPQGHHRGGHVRPDAPCTHTWAVCIHTHASAFTYRYTRSRAHTTHASCASHTQTDTPLCCTDASHASSHHARQTHAHTYTRS